MTTRTGTTRVVYDLLDKCGSTGAHMCTIVANVRGNGSDVTIANSVSKLIADGLIARVQDPAPGSARRLRYILMQHAPKGWERLAPKPRRTADEIKRGVTFVPGSGARSTLNHNQPTIVPKHVRVTRCPGGIDTRYAVPPGAAFEGAGFRAEWAAKRAERGS